MKKKIKKVATDLINPRASDGRRSLGRKQSFDEKPSRSKGNI